MRFAQPLPAVLCSLLLLAPAPSIGEGANRKAGSPIELTIQPRGPLQPGQIGEFTVAASILAESDELILDVDLPDALTLYSGDLHQRSPVRSGTLYLLTFALRVPESGGHTLIATARLRVADAGHFTARAAYRIGSAPVDAPRNTAVVHREAAGIREYLLP